MRQSHFGTTLPNNNIVYTADPNAYKDPKTQNIYTLVTKAVENKEGKIFTPEADAFESGGKIYTFDPKAVVSNGAVYDKPTATPVIAPAPQTLAPIAAVPVVPAVKKADNKKLAAKAGHTSVIILGQMIVTKQGKKLIVFDPKKQSYPVTHVDPTTLSITKF